MSILNEKDKILYFLNEFEECLVKRINNIREELGKTQANLINEVVFYRLDKLHRLLAGEIYPTLEIYFDR